VTDPLFAVFNIGLVFALALGLAIWQLVVLRRGMRRDSEPARTAEREGDPP
jgi:hypothetical protein